MYDVAIVGARCAGSALALMLAREGLKVIAIERTTFPSDTMSGHFLQPAGVSCLRRLGLFEDLEALRAPAQDTMTVDFGPVVLSDRPAPASDGISAGYAPRRYLFDSMLANAAVAAGAELREGVSFIEPVAEGQRIAGMRVQTATGRTETISARLVVGADGKRSRVARAVGAQSYDTRPAASCMYYGYWSGFGTAVTRLFVRDGLFAVTVPTNDGLTFVGFAWPHAELARVRDHEHPARSACHDLLAQKRAAATLDEAERRIDLVGAIDREVEDGIGVERGQGNPLGHGKLRRPLRGRHAGDIQTLPNLAGKQADEMIRRAARAEAELHAAAHLGQRGFGGADALGLVSGRLVEHQRSRPPISMYLTSMNSSTP